MIQTLQSYLFYINSNKNQLQNINVITTLFFDQYNMAKNTTPITEHDIPRGTLT